MTAQNEKTTKKKLTVAPDPYGHRLTNGSDVNLRYNESVVLIQDVPYYLKYTGATNWRTILGYKYLEDKGRFSENYDTFNILDNKDISLDFDLGYFNSGVNPDLGHQYCVHLERVPTRRYKQGLSTNNVNAASPRTDRNNMVIFRNCGLDNIIISGAILKNEPKYLYTSKMSSKDKIDGLLKVLDKFYTNKNNLNNYTKKDMLDLSCSYSVGLSKRVALLFSRSTLDDTKSKIDWDPDKAKFHILLEREVLGVYTPYNNEVRLHRDGLFSIVEPDLINAGLIN